MRTEPADIRTLQELLGHAVKRPQPGLSPRYEPGRLQPRIVSVYLETQYSRSTHFVPSPDVPHAKILDQSRVLIVAPTVRSLVTLRAPQPDTRYPDLGNYELDRLKPNG
jgi:hypothetical protein